MNEIKEHGYIVAGLKKIDPISYEEFKADPEETHIPIQFISRNLKEIDILKDSFSVRMSDIQNADYFTVILKVVDRLFCPHSFT